MEKLDKVIRALEGCVGGDGCVNGNSCEYNDYSGGCDACMAALMGDALAVIKDLQEKLKTAKDGRLELARQYQALEADLRKDIEAQGEIILELNRDLKRCREALNGQGECKYLGGDLISREALRERIENIDWYHEDECGKSTVMRQGACSEEDAWFKAPDIFAAVRDTLAVEAEPVVHAHWVSEIVKKCDWKGRKRDYYQPYSCPVCHTPDLRKGESKYCSECGAHMDEEVADG